MLLQCIRKLKSVSFDHLLEDKGKLCSSKTVAISIPSCWTPPGTPVYDIGQNPLLDLCRRTMPSRSPVCWDEIVSRQKAVRFPPGKSPFPGNYDDPYAER